METEKKILKKEKKLRDTGDFERKYSSGYTLINIFYISNLHNILFHNILAVYFCSPLIYLIHHLNFTYNIS